MIRRLPSVSGLWPWPGSLFILLLLAGLARPVGAQDQVLVFSFGRPLRIPPSGLAGAWLPQSGLYEEGPPVLRISGVPGTITRLRVRLHQLTHDTPEDLDLLLTGPGGQAVLLMSDAGGSSPLLFADLLFEEDAPEAVPQAALEGSRFRPTDYEPGDQFPAPAPPPPYASSFAPFLGTDPNGEWRLFVLDDTLRPGEADGFAGPASLQAWSLEIVTTESDAARPPVNDAFEHRLLLSGLSGTVQVPSTGVSPGAEPGEPTLPGAPAAGGPRSLWFTWTSPADGRVSFLTERSSYLPRLALYTGSTLADLVPLPGIGEFPVRAGTTYQLRVDATQEPGFGNLVLSWEVTGSRQGPVHFASVQSPGIGYQVLIHVAGTDFLRVTDYETGDSEIPFQASRLWTGLYLFDYGAGRFVSAMHDRGHGLEPAPSGGEQASGGGNGGGGHGSGGAGGSTGKLPRQSLSFEDSAPPRAPRYSGIQSVAVEVFAPGAGWQELVYNFTTGESCVTPFQNSGAMVPFRLPAGQWVGIYHFDYVAGRFTEFDLRLNLTPGGP